MNGGSSQHVAFGGVELGRDASRSEVVEKAAAEYEDAGIELVSNSAAAQQFLSLTIRQTLHTSSAMEIVIGMRGLAGVPPV